MKQGLSNLNFEILLLFIETTKYLEITMYLWKYTGVYKYMKYFILFSTASSLWSKALFLVSIWELSALWTHSEDTPENKSDSRLKNIKWKRHIFKSLWNVIILFNYGNGYLGPLHILIVNVNASIISFLKQIYILFE